MAVEVDAVHRTGGVILDLTAFGPEPPDESKLDEEAVSFLEAMKKTLIDAASMRR
jgi:hypothetical protein